MAAAARAVAAPRARLAARAAATTTRRDVERAVAPPTRRSLLAATTTTLLLATTAAVARADEEAETDDGTRVIISTSSAATAAVASPLECASDPSCVVARDASLAGGGSYAPPTEFVEEDPDGALRRAICPRNPTADICRSVKDRKKINDSPCLIPIGLACAMWKK